MELPKFKYHPNVFTSKVFEKTSEICPICQELKGIGYTFEPSGDVDLIHICPWCIANGDASKKFDVCFNDIPVNPFKEEEVVSNSKFTEELTLKTPAYISLQYEVWPTHCGDYCAFDSYVGWDEISHLEEELREDIDIICDDMDVTRKDLKNELFNGGDHQGYLFKCCHCGKHRLYTDEN